MESDDGPPVGEANQSVQIVANEPNNESAEPSSRGFKGVKFSLEDAYLKKLALRESYTKKVNKRNWQFSNSHTHIRK